MENPRYNYENNYKIRDYICQRQWLELEQKLSTFCLIFDMISTHKSSM